MMAVAFSVDGDLESRVEFEDNGPTVELAVPTMKVIVITAQASIAIDVDAYDLARALITASPVFAGAVGDIVGQALLGMIEEA